MFVAIENTPLRYAWGARGALGECLGDEGALVDPEWRAAKERGEEPPRQAEIWFGAHHGSPSRLVEPGERGADLARWIAADPAATLGPFASGFREGDGPRLPFLLKILAAGKPLSLQVHPSLEEARAGFAYEEQTGLERTAPNRTYRDPFHKPELIVALSDAFSAVVGFREFADAKRLVAAVAGRAGQPFAPFADRVARIASPEELQRVVAWVLSGEPEALAAARAVDAWIAADGADFAIERENLARIRSEFPEDAGVLTVLLMNQLRLERGEALYVPAGTIHAYLDGVGVEVMAASDNVLRGGLTTKHVDALQLLRVLDCTPMPDPRLAPEVLGEGCIRFRGEEPDFQLHRVTGGRVEARVEFDGPAIVLCLGGGARLRGAAGETQLRRGEAVYATPEEGPLSVLADDVVIASAGSGPAA
ncbi:mannose-6-phosphate isomerase, class I [Gulosibacter sp. 10]|uniref:mannose-6-phosphate isomerase, class I n=1 Tax=Gulosibacter sp. 10 TaxID=1255570 RepID=UPI00097E8C2B|nr:mannose-6-phosphate isomerase, class I [Gulosibacter sp. 10]SJM58918.1 Mannose-6-phosphate isomerase [Gulosibacter sp. 10]